MKIIVDKMPKDSSKCPFSRFREGEVICLLDEHSPISSCFETDWCPYLITFDNHLANEIKRYNNGLL